METDTLTLTDAKDWMEDAVRCLCKKHGYQPNVPNEEFDPEEPISAGNQKEKANPVSKKDFATEVVHRWLAGQVEEVRNQEAAERLKQAEPIGPKSMLDK